MLHSLGKMLEGAQEEASAKEPGRKLSSGTNSTKDREAPGKELLIYRE
jgi:hypothetical protein